jgi:hypothetical protein
VNYFALLKGVAVLALILIAFSSRSSQSKAKRYDDIDSSKPSEMARLSGVVQSVRRGEGKVYLEVKSRQGATFWVGAADQAIENGSLISFEMTVPQHDYQARSLGLKIPTIYFTSHLQVEPPPEMLNA